MAVLSELRIGLRTFYRELELLKRCGIKVRQRSKLYSLSATAEQADGHLPFPDPQLSFAEMAELAQCDCPTGRRLADLLAVVINQPQTTDRRKIHPGKGRNAVPRGKQPEARPRE
jgi:hypothetical protein